MQFHHYSILCHPKYLLKGIKLHYKAQWPMLRWMIWRSESIVLPPLFYLLAAEKDQLKTFGSWCICKCRFWQNNSVHPLVVWITIQWISPCLYLWCFFHMMVFQHNSTVIVSIHAFAVNLPDYKHRYIASCASGYIEATANSLNFEKWIHHSPLRQSYKQTIVRHSSPRRSSPKTLIT